MSNLKLAEKNDSFIGVSIPSSMLAFIESLSVQSNATKSEVVRAILRSFQENNAQSE